LRDIFRNILRDILRCVLHKSSLVFIHQCSSFRSFGVPWSWCRHMDITQWCRGFEERGALLHGGAADEGDVLWYIIGPI